MMNKKFMIGGCAAVAVAGNVFAADESISYFNSYASLKGGYAFLGKRNNIKYKGGVAGAVEFGVSYDAWRLGLELGYKQNKIKEVNNGRDITKGSPSNLEDYGKDVLAHWGMFATKNGDGKYDVFFAKVDRINALTGMVNVYYDYAVTENWLLYAGVGLGVAKVSYRMNERTSTQVVDDLKDETVNGKFDKDDTAFKKLVGSSKTELSKTVFAWQFTAGVGYEFNENWKLTLGYKLFNTAKVKVFGDEKIKTPFNHTLEAGLTYSF